MTINDRRHSSTNLMRCATRPLEQYGDVELSVQASRFHTSDPRNGCGHTPLELYHRVEVSLRWANARTRNRWIRQPSRELGIDGLDDLWLSPEEVPIAECVPQGRVRALRAALAERAARRKVWRRNERACAIDGRQSKRWTSKRSTSRLSRPPFIARQDSGRKGAPVGD